MTSETGRQDNMTATITESANTESEMYWGIVTTGHVYSFFFGTKQAAEEYIRSENAKDDNGYSEIITGGMTREESYDWLDDMK
jgi:hypothetical protein